MAKPGESIVKGFLEGKGLTVLKIPEGKKKTVDFEVYSAAGLVFYLEEKTLELTPPAWKDIDPVYNAIAKHVREAGKQFRSVNPERIVPNVLSFTNRNPARDINYLFGALTGHVITAGGKMRRLQPVGGMESNLQLINLYLWFDDEQLSGHIWAENDPDTETKLAAVLGLE